MHFGEAEPRFHSSYQAERQSLVTRVHSAAKLAIRATSVKATIRWDKPNGIPCMPTTRLILWSPT